MEKSLRNPSLKTLYSVLKNFREEYTDFEALASYYEDHYQDQNSKNLNLKHFLLTCVEDPRMRAKENIAQYILMLDSLEVLKRERASLKNAKLPPGHPTRLQNRRQNYEYLRLQNTIKHHFRHFHIELLREQKLREAARKKQTHKQTPAAKEKEHGATAAAEEEALASQGKEGAKEKEEEEEAAPGEVQQALEENEKEGAEEGGPAEDQAPAVEEKMEEQSPAVEEQAGMKRKRNEEEDPAAENKEERVDGEEAPPEVERLTLRKRPRKDYRGFSIPPEDSSDSSAASDATLLLACLLWLFVHICVFVCVYVCL
ncbi:myb-like protein X [Xenopus laevis]|uniref:Myb-like protein X n=1 Tax=Xenopus laevis TaxID=8355 RepID=A0A8J1LHP7_XENLA|nr:myb-like protein X [Xenopus laevis]